MAAQAVVAEDGDSLVDGLFFGEGEGQVGALVRALHDGAGEAKRDRLARAAAQVRGLWVAGGWPERPVEKAVLASPEAAHALVDYPLLNGGEAGMPAVSRVIRVDGNAIELRPNDGCDVTPGDRFVLETPGGGGYGKKIT